MIDSKLISALKNIPPEELAAHGVIKPARTMANGYPTFICPICGNGTGKSGDGLAVFETSKGFGYKCFKCGKFFDNISLLAIYYGLDSRLDFVKVCNRAAAEFLDESGNYIHVPATSTELTNNQQLKENQSPPADAELNKIIGTDILNSYQRLKELPANERRGLSLETLQHFYCGYAPNWISPVVRIKGGKVPPTRRIIIPTSWGHYNAILLKGDRAEANKKYWKMQAGTADLFGKCTINKQTKNIFVTEGEIDAMSLFQVSTSNDFLLSSMLIFGAIEAVNEDTGEIIEPADAFVATGGAANTKWIDLLKRECKEKNINPNIIVVFDDDDTGRLNAPKRVAELKRRGFSACEYYLERG